MTTKRASIFDNDEIDLSGFEPKVEPAADALPQEQVRAIAEASNFPSREAKKPAPPVAPKPPVAKAVPPKPAPRRQYRTGRSAQINVRASAETVEAFYAIVDGRRWSAADTMERAVAALQRELAQEKN